jgi:ankyrin repeat protein
MHAVKGNPPFDTMSCLVNELGADVNKREEVCGFTALMTASVFDRNFNDTICFLVEDLGAGINTPDNNGSTPL